MLRLLRLLRLQRWTWFHYCPGALLHCFTSTVELWTAPLWTPLTNLPLTCTLSLTSIQIPMTLHCISIAIKLSSCLIYTCITAKHHWLSHKTNDQITMKLGRFLLGPRRSLRTYFEKFSQIRDLDPKNTYSTYIKFYSKFNKTSKLLELRCSLI